MSELSDPFITIWPVMGGELNTKTKKCAHATDLEMKKQQLYVNKSQKCIKNSQMKFNHNPLIKVFFFFFYDSDL